jgi:hypothetical protein
MKTFLRTLAVSFPLVLLPTLVRAQAASTDRSEMDQWMKMTEHQSEPPAGTTITMANWRQYQSVMPLGMIKLFQGVYGWKMPADVQMPVGTPGSTTCREPGWLRLKNTVHKFGWRLRPPAITSSGTTTAVRRSRIPRTPTKVGKSWRM